MEWVPLLTLGFLLAAALIGGVLGGFLRLPKVTSFLLTGVLVAPLLPMIVPEEFAQKLGEHGLVGQLQPLAKLAIALVLFHLGCHFPLPRIRKIWRRVVRLSMGELGMTAVLVTVGLLALGADWRVALLLGALALETAPATTILVLREAQSEGDVTELTTAMVAVSNLAAIVLFELALLGILFTGEHLERSIWMHLGGFSLDLVGSATFGVIAGMTVSIAYPIVNKEQRLAFLVALVALLLGVALWMHIPYLLAFLVMGLTVANSSYDTREVPADLDQLTGLLCVVFFVVHGAELEVEKLWQVGVIGVGYILLRSIGKYLGVWIAARPPREGPEVRQYLGLTLLSQAGAAITLSAMAVERMSGFDEPLVKIAAEVSTIILGSVVVFEIIGPLLIRHGVRASGEVPLVQAIYHPGVSLFEQVRAVFNRVILMAGFNPWGGKTPEQITVGEMTRRNITPVQRSATFDDVVKVIEHSRDNTFPVVDPDGVLVGVIRYRELTGALFEPTLGTLVRAQDLMTAAGETLTPEDSIEKAIRLFSLRKDDCIPVVSIDPQGQFLGLLRRRDLMRFQIRGLG